MKRKQAAHLSTPIETVIRTLRGERVILDTDLARIYGVRTRALNQAVKRNIKKFPADFMFRLTRSDAESLVRSRSQPVTLKRGQNIKYIPYAFTEHGAIKEPRSDSPLIFRWHPDNAQEGPTHAGPSSYYFI